MRRCFSYCAAVVLVVLGFASVTLARDVEPNGSCAQAEDLRLDSAQTLQGSLDAADATPTSDVDYYRIRATPGARVEIRTIGRASLATGTFDAACQPSTRSVGSGGFARISVPESGVFFLAVGDPDDADLDGNGLGNPGRYDFVISEREGVFAIAGVAVDVQTGAPVAAADVRLETCAALFCNDFPVARTTTAELGDFIFERDFRGEPIPAGTYRVVVEAPGYRTAPSVVFGVTDRDFSILGDIFLTPQACLATPAAR